MSALMKILTPNVLVVAMLAMCSLAVAAPGIYTTTSSDSEVLAQRGDQTARTDDSGTCKGPGIYAAKGPGIYI